MRSLLCDRTYINLLKSHVSKKYFFQFGSVSPLFSLPPCKVEQTEKYKHLNFLFSSKGSICFLASISRSDTLPVLFGKRTNSFWKNTQLKVEGETEDRIPPLTYGRLISLLQHNLSLDTFNQVLKLLPS